MQVSHVLEQPLSFGPSEDDVGLNDSDQVIVLKSVSPKDILQLFCDFEADLRQAIIDLLSLTNEDVLARFGVLNMIRSNLEKSPHMAWGLAPITHAQGKGLARIRNAPAIASLVSMGLIEGRPDRSKMLRGTSLNEFVVGLDLETQRDFIKTAFDERFSLDDALRLHQHQTLGLEELRSSLSRSRHTDLISEMVARAAGEWNSEATRDQNRSYATVWFLGYLARRGILLLPLSISSRASQLYPAWLRPVMLRLAVPTHHSDLAETVLRTSLVRDNRPGDWQIVPFVMASIAWSSTQWQPNEMRVGPLIAYKAYYQRGQGGSATQRCWAVNRLWDLQLEHFEANLEDHPDSHAFVGYKRLAGKGLRPFNWVHQPNTRNLNLFKRVYGKQPEEFPEWLKEWASALEKLLPLFDVVSIQAKINCLSVWLLFLAGSLNPPLSMREIDRFQHINSGGDPRHYTFQDFLTRNYGKSPPRSALDAISTLRQAWQLSASALGFIHQLANPIDLDDSPFEPLTRPSRTVRRAMDDKVHDIIVEENLRDDMAFARSLERRSMREVVDRETGEITTTFFPGLPSLIHAILMTGMRGSQARWLDSGEGDVEVIDPSTLTSRLNTLASAIRGRREGFFRLCSLLGPTRQIVLGMWMNSGKSGPFEVPWVHPELTAVISRMIEWQGRYNPINKPVTIDNNVDFQSKIKRYVGESFPMFRDPNNRLHHPISSDRMRAYWVALLQHCQPLVNQTLGYHYPLLFADGSPRFDIHSIRVTMVTTLLDNGVPVSVVQMLVGHSTPIMTWYYQDISNYKIHTALQQAIKKSGQDRTNPESMSEHDITRLTDESVTLREQGDFVGVDSLRSNQESTAFLDVFAHGICPGGDCETGGARISEGKYKAVWRPRACSGCRFRVTGPAFLAGLVQRANLLIWEIKTSMRQEAEFNADIERREDAGMPVMHLRSQIRAEQARRDNLFQEWALELRTIKMAEAKLHPENSTGSERSALLATSSLAEATTNFREVHELELAQRLVEDAEIVDGALEMLPDIILFRDRALHAIARNNNMGELFVSLPEAKRREALQEFGRLVVDRFADTADMQDLIDGIQRLSPVLQDQAAAALASHVTIPL